MGTCPRRTELKETREALQEELVCTLCGKPGPGLDLQHVVKRSVAPHLLDDPYNKTPLCRNCHNRIDNDGKWGNAIRNLPTIGWAFLWWDVKDGKDGVKEVSIALSKRYGCMVRRELVDDGFAPTHATEVTLGATGEESAGGESSYVTDGSQEVATPRPRSEVGGDEENSNVACSSVVTSPSPPDPFEISNLDFATASSELLQTIFEDADRQAGLWFLVACKAVWEFRRRRMAGARDAWVEEATQLFSRSRRTLFLYAEVWDTWSDVQALAHLDEAVRLPRGTLEIVAQVPKERRREALEEVLSLVAEFGEAQPAAAARRLEEAGIKEPSEYEYVCPECNHIGSLGEFRRKKTFSDS